MSEDTMKSNLLSLYQEAVAGNPAPIIAVCHALEGLYLFDMLPDSIYDFSCMLIQSLVDNELYDYEMEVLYHGKL